MQCYKFEEFFARNYKPVILITLIVVVLMNNLF